MKYFDKIYAWLNPIKIQMGETSYEASAIDCVFDHVKALEAKLESVTIDANDEMASYQNSLAKTYTKTITDLETRNGELVRVNELFTDKIFELEDRSTKLKRLLLLTDDSLGDVEMNELTTRQWMEYVKCFPDEL